MARVGEQGEGVSEHAIDHLARHEHDVQERAGPESRTEVGGRMMMLMAASMPVAVIMMARIMTARVRVLMHSMSRVMIVAKMIR